MTQAMWDEVAGVIATVHRGGRDRFGDQKPSTTHTVNRVVFAPRGSTETVDLANTVVTGGTLFLPPGSDLRATDQVELPQFPGVRWDVEGDVGPWGNPWTGQAVGMQAAIARAAG